MAPLTTTLGTPLGPDFTLTLDGKNISGQVRPRLISLSATLNRGTIADSLTLDLDDSDGKLALPTRGKLLLASIGWQGQPLTLLGSFIVNTLQHSGAPDKLTITASSADFSGSLSEKHKESYFDGNTDRTTLGSIIRIIAARNGLQASIAPEFAQLTVISAHQTDEADMDFLTKLATQYGAIADIKYGTLMLLKPGTGRSASRAPLPAVVISRSQGDSHKFTLADRTIYTAVEASWQDINGAQQKTLPTLSVPTAQNAGQAYIREGGKQKIDKLPRIYPDEASARLAAQARVESLQRLSATMSIKLASGREDLVPETTVTLAGFKSQFNEVRWIITKVEHTLGAEGFTTTLALETAP
ncbi:late control protein D [Chimaeribacter californicus]|uniref:Late control protein D n=1 Tax=Chimaeribacter californicus TaxID=2060067 RepID=A0A2N5EEH1_9GAMM|nr:contractile injection system protein, VgrG/Pvc8 family [Chimaeribacter californicus]PLR40933.1 late control protein D [Chimaeribacter californicus]